MGDRYHLLRRAWGSVFRSLACAIAQAIIQLRQSNAKAPRMSLPRVSVSNWQQKIPRALVWGYLLLLLGAMVAVGISTARWMRWPFLGAIVEPTGYFSHLGPEDAGTWMAVAQGLRFPDRLLRVEGKPYRGPGSLRQLLRPYQPGEWVTLLVDRHKGGREVVVLPLQRFPEDDRWLYFYGPYLVGWIYLVAGWWVFLARRREVAARWFGVGVSSAGFAVGSLLNALAVHAWSWLWSLALGVTAGALLALALAFLRSAFAAVRLSWQERGGLLLGLGLGVWGSVALYDMAHPLMYVVALRAIEVYLALAMLFYLGVNLKLRVSARSPLVRERAGLTLWSAVLAFGPLSLWALASALGLDWPFSLWFIFPLALFPLGTAYALLRYRWFYVETLLEQGWVYALLVGVIFGGYALVVAGLSLTVGARWMAQHPWWVGVFAFVLALGLEPLRRWLETLAERVFVRRRQRYRERLEAFGQALIPAATEAQIWELLRQFIATDLAAQPIHLFVRDPLTGDYRPAVDTQGATISDVHFRRESPFVRFLSRVEPGYYFGAEERPPAWVQDDLPRILLLQAVLFVPLPGQEKDLVGFLALGPRRGALYLRPDIEYLQRLARQAALALERARVATTLSRRVTQLNTLMRVAQGINAVPDMESLLELVAAHTQRLIPSSWLQIVLWDPRRERYVRVLALRGEERVSALEQVPLAEDEGLVWWVIRERRVQRTAHYEQACRAQGVLPEDKGLVAWMGAPLFAGEELVGVLAVGHTRWDIRYTAEHQDLLQTMADLAVGAMVKARLIRQSEQRARQLALLNEMGRTITGTLNLNELQERLLTNARRLLDAHSARLWLVEPGTEAWGLAAQQGELKEQTDPQPSPWVFLAAERLEPLCWPPQRAEMAEALGQQPPEPGVTTALVVPLVAQEKVVGVLELLDKRDGTRFTVEEGQLLLALASQAAVAIENARLYAQTDRALAARVEELTAMELIDRELNASLDLRRAMRVTLQWAMRRTQSAAALIGLLREDRLRILAEEGFGAALASYREDGLPLDWVGIRRALTTSTIQRLTADNVAEDFALRPGTQAQVVVPILREGQVLAVLLLESDTKQAYGEEELRFLARLVEHAAIAITNAQLYAAVQEANRTKSEFVSFVAHELKTPMTSIRGYTDLLRSGVVGPINDNQRNFLDIIRTNVERMAALVSDLADISRIEAGQLRLNFQRISVPQVVEEVVSSLGPQIEAKQQELLLEVPPDLPEVWADPMRLAQILTNLVSNAHKYTPEGGRIRVVAEVTANQWDPQGPPRVVHLAVEDTGLGIHPEEQKRIFQRFFRSEADQSAREQPGTGLGLYITKNLVELQGGRIWFESVYRQGTTFHFTVPVATAAEEAEASSMGEAESSTGA